MKDRLYFHIPKFEELNYRQKIMSQPETMNYNKGYDVSYDGYHKDTGCIDFEEDEWSDWYCNRVGKKPKYFYAYISKKDDDSFIGEVNLNLNNKDRCYDMGVIIEGKHRGCGYSKEALNKLMKVAFEEYNALEVHNDFEATRISAMKVHKNAGFMVVDEVNGVIKLIITKDDYMNKRYMSE